LAGDEKHEGGELTIDGERWAREAAVRVEE
jgi:hypothetical protein